MKKKIALLLVVVMVTLLAGCGETGIKRAQAESQFETLDALFQRAGTAVTGIKAVVAGSDIVDANFDEYYNALSMARDELAVGIDGLKKLEDAALDALLSSLDSEVKKAQATVASLEALMPEIEKVDASAKALAGSLTAIVPLVQGAAASPELQREYTELATAYQAMEGQLNGMLGQGDGSDLAAVLEGTKQANSTLSEAANRAENLLNSLEATKG